MPAPEPPKGAHRRWIAWLVVVLAGIGVALSFSVSREDEASASGARRAKLAVVSAAEVTRGPLAERGRYPGELTADTADVATFYAGRLVAVKVRVGDVVAAGDVLAELDPVDAAEQLARARAQAAAASAEERRAGVELAAAIVEIERQAPLAGEVVSEADVAAMRARAEVLRAAAATAAARGAEARAGVALLARRITESTVRAPFAGRISARYVDPGAIVAAGAPLARLVAEAPLRVRFDVPSADVTSLAAGEVVAVEVRGDEGRQARAKVSGVAGEIQRERRVAAVEAVVDAPPRGWLPGMFAEVVVERRRVEDAALVPAAAVLSRLGPDGKLGDGVFVLREGEARWTPGRVVARDGATVAVEAEGCAAGDRVLVAGHVDLPDVARVEVAGGAGTGPTGSASR